jgi:mannose-6-phosphate isomerase-like protein (cupin superfamily)
MNIKIVDNLPEELRLKIQEEINLRPTIWVDSHNWCKQKHRNFLKQQTCVPLIVEEEEGYVKSPFYEMFPVLTGYMEANYPTVVRINLQKIRVLDKYHKHVDEGEYFLDKDRYSMCIQGTYKFYVGDEMRRINQGDVLWFDNKKPHEAVNIGAKERIAIIFDIPKENGCKS